MNHIIVDAAFLRQQFDKAMGRAPADIIDRIINRAAFYTGMTAEEIKRTDKARARLTARGLVYAVLRRLGYSTLSIATAMDVAHSTVSRSSNRAYKRCPQVIEKIYQEVNQ